MNCPLCGNQFREEEGEAACQGCPMLKGCHLVKCPNCGYEVPREPGLLKNLRDWWRQRNGPGRKG
ncbi:MAG: hypothetical protein HY670_08070 [Chloroflexi bacterium]|nr:hypothetical protein [Chloroflexota bacterium]